MSGQFHRDRGRMVDVGDWERGNRESVFNGDRIAALKDGKVLKRDSDGHT